MEDYEKKFKEEAEKLLQLVDTLEPDSKAEEKWIALAKFVILEYRLLEIIRGKSNRIKESE